MKRLNKVKIEWSPEFSYALGLLATDGNLSKDGRHMELTSKDEELILSFKECFGIKNKIGRKSRGGSKEKRYFRIQFGDKNFYDFLLSIGFTPAKSRTLGRLMISNEYFADFLRGCIDGDGNIRIAKHPESRHPQLRIRLCSASPPFLHWVKDEISQSVGLRGGWIEQNENIGVLSYAKSDSIKLLNFIYYSRALFCLNRKYIIAEPFLRT